MICENCTEEFDEDMRYECSVCGYDSLCRLCMADHQEDCYAWDEDYGDYGGEDDDD